MYTILVTDDNTLFPSVRQRIMQRSKLIDTLHFLASPIYKVEDNSGYDKSSSNSIEDTDAELSEEVTTIVNEEAIIDEDGNADMTKFTAVLEYILPVSKEYKTEVLNLTVNNDGTAKTYHGRLEYKLPLDTNLTSEPGDIECKITFYATEMDESGNGKQYVRPTSSTTITIIPITAWSDIIPDKALNAIDQRILKTDAQIKALAETSDLFASTKADDIVLDNETQELYLTANGEQIGNKISMKTLTNSIVESSCDEGLITMMI